MAGATLFTSVFADTGDNMNLKPNAIREKNETDQNDSGAGCGCSSRCGLCITGCGGCARGISSSRRPAMPFTPGQPGTARDH